jgi:hypothetical protein
MQNFVDKTSAGNERAFRRGKRVPDGDVNLAWVKSPELTPDNNVVILDTSRTVEENKIDFLKKTHLMYANSLGILEDEFGNQVIDDEYPCVADVFTQDEDFLVVPGNEYNDDDPLPFVHISRYFHADFAGITLGTELQSYNSKSLQVVDESGRNYVNDSGDPRYRIRITPAYSAIEDTVLDESTGIYRVWAFVDTNTNESLYLRYNKIELNTSGQVRDQNVDFTEILNPEPYFRYVPEESDVIDPANRNKKIYTTKPISKKSKAVGQTEKDIEGYRVHVPKKAIPDPRLYQLFRWRVSCDFVQDYKVRVDKVDEDTLEQVNVGVIVTNQQTDSYAAFALNNLENSNYNKSNVRFINPLSSENDKQKAAYWHVNINSITDTQLALYDVLILSTVNPSFDMSQILGKVNYFVNTIGGTILVDTNNQTSIQDFGFTFSDTFYPTNGATKVTGSSSDPLRANTITASDDDHEIMSGLSSVGGWDIDDTTNNFDSVTLYSNGVLGQYIQSIESYPSDYTEIMSGTTSTGSTKPVLVGKVSTGDSGSRRGRVFVTTMGLGYSVSAFTDSLGELKYSNYSRDNIINTASYDEYINSSYNETASKLLYNIVLLSTKGKYINVDLTGDYSSVWTATSDWSSSWAVDGTVLSDHEKGINDFVFLPKNPTGDTDTVWQRRLSTKTLRQLVDEQLDSDQLIRVDNSTRSYRIETTNLSIGTPTVLADSTIPHAWSEAYSPVFLPPIDLGAHVVRSELIQGKFDAGNFVHKSYPSRNYALQSQFTYSVDADSFVDQTTTWTATGTATKTTKYIDKLDISEPTTTTNTSTVTRDEEITWAGSGSESTTIMDISSAWNGSPRPDGITTWQEQNYYTSDWGTGLESWPFWGMTSRYSTSENNSGEIVKFIQTAINLFKFWGITGGFYLVEDGKFGNATRTALLTLQSNFNAKYIDGVVGAESWGIIGMGILRTIYTVNTITGTDLLSDYRSFTDHRRFFAWPSDRADMFNISNGDPSKAYVKKSWVRSGPSTIWDMFTVVFPVAYDIHAVTVIPYVEGAANDCMVRSLHITPNIVDMTNWDAKNSLYTYMPYRPRDGQELTIPVGPHNGRQIILGMGQDNSSGFGSARIFGVRDIRAHVKTTKTITDTKTIPGGSTFIAGKTEVENVTFTQTGTVTVNASGSKVIAINALDSLDTKHSGKVEYINYNNIQFTNITSSNANVEMDFSTQSNKAMVIFSTSYSVNNTQSKIKYGQKLPVPDGGFTYFSKAPSGFVNSGPEAGWVSKGEGVKLLCDSLGAPVGIPAIPNDANTQQGADNILLTLASLGTDPSVEYGFYNIAEKAFITSGLGGLQVLSYEEILEIGIHKIFIAVVTTYEVAEKKDLPDASDAPLIPRLWAMPVYGICYRAKSRIGIDPLPKGLGSMDLWSIPIRTGSFDKNTYIPERTSTSITHWSQSHEGTTLRAFYGVPEAANGAWSLLYGRPNVDVRDEIPNLFSDNVVQVRQAPILMMREPTVNDSWADPIRPVFTVYTRLSINDPWTALGWEDILDYNVSTGKIYLKSPLAAEDENLVKISYTSSRKVYDLKQYAGDKINLNPYILPDENLIGKPIYIYIVPEYVHSESGELITGSVETTTVRWTTDPGIFAVLDSAMYNPLAIRLGIVYITNSADIENLTMLDTRHRGGGSSESFSDGELIREYGDPKSYWDVNYASGESYQSGGFILIRLPAELKTRFPDDKYIMEVIDRNIPAGVGYKIEDLNGNTWR